MAPDPQRGGPEAVGRHRRQPGAIAGSLAAGVEPRFTRAAIVLGGGDPGAIAWHAPELARLKQHLQAQGRTREDLRTIAKGVDPIAFAGRVDASRVLMINALNDKTIPRECTVALWKALGKPEIQWLPAGHYTMSFFIPIILPKAFAFLREPR